MNLLIRGGMRDDDGEGGYHAAEARDTRGSCTHVDNETLPKLKPSLKQPLDVSRIFHHLPRSKRTFEKIFL